MFITLPKVFESMKLGGLIGAAFFILVLFAAATSAVSLMETNVHTISQELKISRKKAITCVLGHMLRSWAALFH